ncbi:MAG: hypothetical protein ACYTG1_01605 [Planctomycetota bacterium]|jgi:hypothetical protein
MWSVADVADVIEAGLRRCAERLDGEQAVRGLDALDEIALHPVLAESLADAGYGIHREQRYPADRRRRRESAGERCDLVLVPDARDLRHPDRAATLFDDPEAVDLDEGLWLEVKVVAQHREEGPNHNYSAQLLAPVRQDVTKLSKDAGILHAALLIVLFVTDGPVADHDLRVWQEKCLDHGLPIGAPYRRSFDIRDRLGNAVCALALFPVHHL